MQLFEIVSVLYFYRMGSQSHSRLRHRAIVSSDVRALSDMLAVVFGDVRFHTCLFGKRFLVQSDQKPLEMIHCKNLTAAPQILHRLLLRLQPHDFELRYKPGKKMTLADTMSRQPCLDKEHIEFDVPITFVQFSMRILQELREETQADDELCALKRTIITKGWPVRQ